MKRLRIYALLLLFVQPIHSQKLVSVISETVTVNSTSSLNGYTRNFVEASFPKGTIGYVYRVSVFDVNGTSISEYLFDALLKIPIEEIQIGASFAKYIVNNSNGHAVDYFILTTQEDKNAFYSKNDNNWSSCKSFPNRVSTCSSSNECINSKIYFCFRNNNLTKGLDVHIEIVALVDENNSSSYNYGYRITNLADRELEFELSTDGLNWTKYSLLSNYFNNYNFNVSEIQFRIATNGKGYKTYRLDSVKKYKIEWNSTSGIWDLFTH